jgi:GTP cyclohydrolase I
MDLEAAAGAIDAFLKALGRDSESEPDLAGTGRRVAAAFASELLTGYSVDVDALLAESVFRGRSGLVVVRDVPVTTTCPHHLMPSTGSATLAFGPRDRLVGVGTIARVIQAFSRRLSLQEKIGENAASAIQRHLEPAWTACRITLDHACITARDPGARGTRVETLAVCGEVADAAEIHAIVGVGR